MIGVISGVMSSTESESEESEPTFLFLPISSTTPSQGSTVTVQRFEKFHPSKFFSFVVCNRCQSSPSLTTLVPLWLLIISFVFVYLCIVLFLVFLQFRGRFVDGQNKSKYRDYAKAKNKPTKDPVYFSVNLISVRP